MAKVKTTFYCQNCGARALARCLQNGTRSWKEVGRKKQHQLGQPAEGVRFRESELKTTTHLKLTPQKSMDT
jgi:predicted ATP-dependent serine protease